MQTFTPHIDSLVAVLERVAPEVGLWEPKILTLLPYARQAFDSFCAEGTGEKAPSISKEALESDKAILERALFINSLEKIPFELLYGNDFRVMHNYLASPKLIALGLESKIILDQHLYSGGNFREELLAKVQAISEYLHGARAKEELKARVLSNRENRGDWIDNYYLRHLRIWQELADELWFHWRLDA